jgi:hypothetical protein
MKRKSIVHSVKDKSGQSGFRLKMDVQRVQHPIYSRILDMHPLLGNRMVQRLLIPAYNPNPVTQKIVSKEFLQSAPFPGETPELEQRRKEAISAVQNAAQNIEKGLRSGYLWPFEKAQDTDIQFTSPTLTIPGQAPLETQKDRNARLLKLVDDLWKLVIELQGGPIPQAWQAWKDSSDDVIFPGQGRYGSGFEIDMFYCHRMQEHGMGFAETMRNIHYIDDTPDPKRQIRLRPRDLPPQSELQLGTWLVVKDPVNRPQEWKRLSGFEPIDGEIVELSSDRRGYFYYWYGEKKYLPDYPD